MWWQMDVIPVPRKWRQEDLELKTDGLQSPKRLNGPLSQGTCCYLCLTGYLGLEIPTRGNEQFQSSLLGS